MKVLLLISSPGKGHARCAEAISAALQRRCGDVQSDCLDIHDLVDARVSAAVKDGYLRMTTEQPELYQRLYDLDKGLYQQLAGEVPADSDVAGFLAEQQRRWFPGLAGRPWFANRYPNLDTALINTLVNGVHESWRFPPNRLLLKGVLQLIRRRLTHRVREAVQARGPDVLVATQMYPASLLSQSIETGALKQPLIGVITDYGVHGIWIRSTTRHYCVGHEDTAQMLFARGIPRERVHVTGIPVMPAFEHPPGQPEARRRLGLDDRPTVLVTGGEYGIGAVEAVERIMASGPEDLRVLVTCGERTVGRERLTALAAEQPGRVRMYGWTEEIAVLMRAADLVVGKPGGLTVSESLACGRPFIAARSLGGQEAHNLRFLERHGLGQRVTAAELPQRLQYLLEHPAELVAWQQRAGAAGRRRGARAVAALITQCAARPAVPEAVG